jgi:hypothetical protein
MLDLSKFEGIDEETKNSILEQHQAEITGLKSNKDTILNEKKDLQEKYKAYEGLDPIQAKEALDKLKQIEEQKALDKGEFDKLMTNFKLESDNKTNKISEERDFFKNNFLNSTKENALNKIMDQYNIKNEFRSTLKDAHLHKIEFIGEKNELKPVINNQDISTYFENWSKSDEAKHFISAGLNNGGGLNANNKSFTGTMTKEQFGNLSYGQNIKLLKENPELHKQLNSK